MTANSKVLIVDDDPRVRGTLSDVLKLKGHAPLTAATGKEALERIEAESPAVALIDLKLEDMSGLELMKEMRSRSLLDTACIIITGYASQESAIEAMNLGAYSYLRKPYDVDQLLLTIRRAIEKLEAEQTLRASEEFSSSLMKNAPTPLLVANPDSSLRYVNPALTQLTGFSPSELLGKKAPYPWWTEETLEKSREDFEQALRQGLRGVEELFKKKNGERFWVEISATPSRQKGQFNYYVASWLDITERKEAQQRLEDTFIDLTETVSRAMETRDPYTAGHQRRVAELARLVGEKLGLSADELQGLYIGALLHDIGKISVPESILTKPGRLTQEEWSLIQVHTRQGHEILREATLPWPVAEMALHHHERLDGSGYPDGLSGDQLSREVRILGVCDVVEAMSSHRPYRPARSREEVLKEIEGGRGTKYDARVVEAMLEMISAGALEAGSPHT